MAERRISSSRGRASAPTAALEFSDKVRFYHKNDNSSKTECFKAEHKFECIYQASPVSTQLCQSPPNPGTGGVLWSGCAVRLTLGFLSAPQQRLKTVLCNCKVGNKLFGWTSKRLKSPITSVPGNAQPFSWFFVRHSGLNLRQKFLVLEVQKILTEFYWKAFYARHLDYLKPEKIQIIPNYFPPETFKYLLEVLSLRQI